MRSGDASIYAPGDTCQRLGSSGSAEYISFSAAISDKEAPPVFHGILHRCINDEVAALLRLLEQCRRFESPMNEQKSALYLSALLCAFYEKHAASVPNPHVMQMKQYIHDHLFEQLTPAGVSRAIYLSPNYCNRIFKRYTGESISGYIIRTRIEEAHRRILRGVPLSEVSVSLGYHDYSYFSRQFRKVTGQSPLQLRLRYTEEMRGAEQTAASESDKKLAKS